VLADASDAVPVSRSAAFTLSWTPAAAPSGDLAVVLLEELASTTTTITCTFSQAAGTGTVPAAALSYLTPMASNTDFATLQASAVASTTVELPGWNVTVEARGNGFLVPISVQ
jgi:hypothetical protein